MFHSDPFETQNRLSSLTAEERSYLHDTLEHLKGCRGRSCTIARHSTTTGGSSGAGGGSTLLPQSLENNYTQTHRGMGTKRKSDAMGK